MLARLGRVVLAATMLIGASLHSAAGASAAPAELSPTQVASTGTISGIVTDPVDTPLESVYVEATEQSTWDSATTSTDSTGAYTLDLAPGMWTIRFVPSWDSGLASEYYDDARTWSSATPVLVIEGGAVTADATLDPLATVLGNVTLPDGSPAPDVQVEVIDPNGGTQAWGTTDAAGDYEIPTVPPGTWLLRYRPAFGSTARQEYWENAVLRDDATAVEIAPGSTGQYDVQLVEGGSLNGHVTTTGGEALANVYVELYTITNQWLTSTYTDETGAYTFPVVDADAVKIRFESYDVYAPEWFDDAADFESATVVDTSSGQAAVADAALAGPGSVEGIVTLEGGAPSVGTTVELAPVQCCSSGLSTTTGADGSYAFPTVRRGDYRVVFHPPVGTNYVKEYWDNASSDNNATAIAVESDLTTTATAELTLGGSISGRVTDGNGIGVADVSVRMYDVTYGGYFYATTDANGDYSYPGLFPSSYDTHFAPPGDFLDQRYFAYVGVRAGEDTVGIDAVLQRGGTASGVVHDENGAPVPYAWVTFNGQESADFDYESATANAFGEYEVGGLTPGEYVVRARADGYLTRFWNDRTSQEEADFLVVAADDVLTGIDFTLPTAPDVTGSISGAVTDQNGAPIAGVQIWAGIFGAVTDQYGEYTIEQVPDDSYVVSAGADGYVQEYFDDQRNFGSATTIVVADGGPTTGIDFQLDAESRIEGTVTTVDGQSPSYVSIYAIDQADDVYYHADNYEPTTGEYTIGGLPPGTFSVSFSPYQPSPYLEQYYGGNEDPPGTLVEVTAGSVVTGIDTELVFGGVVSGTVTDTTGAPIPNVDVELDGPEWDSIQTDTNGDYVMRGLRAGDYTAYFRPPDGSDLLDEYYDNQATVDNATPVTVALGVTTADIDAVLGEGTSISGTVTGPMGEPVADATVLVSDDLGSSETATALDGTYTVGGLRPGNYCVEVTDWTLPVGVIGEVYGPDPDQCLPESEVVVADTPIIGIDIQLDEAPTISGRVTDETGEPIEGVVVSSRHDDLWDTYGLTTLTDANGDYTLQGRLVSDVLRFEGPDGAGYVGEFYDDVRNAWDATAITVSRGDALTGYDAVLAIGAVVAGTVTGPDGSPVENVQVFAEPTSGSSLSAWTDPGGGYSFPPLPLGDYRFRFAPPWNSPLLPEYHLDAVDWSDAAIVTIADPTPITIDAQLALGETLRGRVTGPDGVGEPNAEVVVRSSTVWNTTYTDNDGYYTFTRLRPGDDYLLQFEPSYDSDLIGEYHADQTSWESADPITVSGGETVVDAVLARGETVTGTVTDENGAPLEGVTVNASGPRSRSATTLADGTYELSGLVPGDHRFYFGPVWGTNYVPEYYDNTTDWQTATIVNVPSASSIVIDAELATGGTISGTVTLPDGSAAGNLYVTAYEFSGPSSYGSVASTTTASDGTYQLVGLGTGEHGVFVSAYGLAGVANEWYDDAYTATTSTRLAITAGQDVANIDIQLGELGSISGTITDGTTPVAGAFVSWELAGGFGSCFECSTTADETGAYSFPDMQPGAYTIRVDPPGDRPELAGEWHSDAYAIDDATAVNVPPGGAVVVDAALAVGAVIEGTITGEGAGPLADVYVSLSGTGNTTTDAAGTYRFEGVPPTDQRLYVGAWNTDYADEWYNEQASYETATPIVAPLGTTQTIDIELPLGGTIDGQVTDELGAPIPNVCVTLGHYRLADQAGCHGWTDQDGNYSIARMRSGDQAVCFSTIGYAPECYENRLGPLSADPVSIIGGSAVAANAVLGAGGALEVTVTDSGVPVDDGVVFVEEVGTGGNWWLDAVDFAYFNGQPFSVPNLLPGGYQVRYTGNAGETQGLATVLDGQTTAIVLDLSGDSTTVPAPTGSPTAVAGDAEVEVTWAAPDTDGGAPITDYVVEYRAVGVAAWSIFADDESTATSTTVTGLTNGTAYVFRVAAVNSVGQGAFSPASNQVTPSAPVVVTVPGVPGAPSVAAGNSQAAFTWAAPASDGGASVTDYVVQYKTVAAGSWSTFADGVSSTPSATVTGLVNGTAYVFRVAAVNSVGQGAFSPASNQVTPAAPTPVDPTPTTPPPLDPVVPGRLLETRVGPGLGTVDGKHYGGGRSAAGSVTEFVVAGRGGVEPNASAVMLNVIAIQPSGNGYLTIFPCGEDVPNASSVNYVAGQVVPNAVLAKVGEGGKVCIFTKHETHLVADVNGYVPVGGSPAPVVPGRLLETRTVPGSETVDGKYLGAGRSRARSVTEFVVAGRGGVDHDAAAVILNVTAVRPATQGYLTVFPCGEEVPNASSVNYRAGQVVPNAVLAKIGVDGKVCIFTLGETDLIVDVNAFVPKGGSPTPVLPVRLLETRSGPGLATIDGSYDGAGRVAPGSITEFVVNGRGGVDPDASAVMLNLIAIQPSGPGFLTVFPCGEDVPNASSVNYRGGDVVPNAVLAKVGTGGKVCVFTTRETHLVADVNGFVPG